MGSLGIEWPDLPPALVTLSCQVLECPRTLLAAAPAPSIPKLLWFGLECMLSLCKIAGVGYFFFGGGVGCF